VKKLFVLVFFVLTGLCFFSCDVNPDAVYKVIYHGNGSIFGYPPVDTKEYKSGMEAIVLGQNDLNKPGYTFQGWNTRANGAGGSYVEGNVITIHNLNVFLYAMWEKN
jgi:uncharacterized repeat protein (TIGR02543 family)